MEKVKKKSKEFYDRLREFTEFEKISMVNQRKQRNIMFSSDLEGKGIVYFDNVFFDDGSVDVIYYYIDEKDDLRNPATIIWVDYASEQKRRKQATKEFYDKRKKKC